MHEHWNFSVKIAFCMKKPSLSWIFVTAVCKYVHISDGVRVSLSTIFIEYTDFISCVSFSISINLSIYLFIYYLIDHEADEICLEFYLFLFLFVRDFYIIAIYVKSRAASFSVCVPFFCFCFCFFLHCIYL